MAGECKYGQCDGSGSAHVLVSAGEVVAVPERHEGRRTFALACACIVERLKARGEGGAAVIVNEVDE